MATTSDKRFLLFGVTGKTGKHVLTSAIASGVPTTVFVRRPEAIPEDQRSKITVIKGDYTDTETVKKAVLDSDPSAIIITASLPAKSPVQDFNAKVVPEITGALSQAGRLGKVHIVYLGGAFSPAKGEPLPFGLKVLATIASPLLGLKSQIADNTKTAEYFYKLQDTENSLSFTFVRMGMVAEGASLGELKAAPKGTAGAGKVVFADVGALLVKLGLDLGDAKNRAIEMQY